MKVKDDRVHGYVKMTLKVPRGLLEFLENLERVGGPNPKERLEFVLTKELEYILSDLPDDTFDMKFLRVRYGEGSETNDVKEVKAD